MIDCLCNLLDIKGLEAPPVLSSSWWQLYSIIITLLNRKSISYQPIPHLTLTVRLDEKEKNLIHTLSQIANSVAQNKIGSGFDISACVFGHQIYSRFPESAIQPIVSAVKMNPSVAKINMLVPKR